MRCEWVPPQSAQWTRILSALPHDFYHLPSYVQMCARTEGGTAGAFVVDDSRGRFIAPLIVRELGGGLRDATSPYGYPSPLWRSAEGPEFTRLALRALLDELRTRGIITAFVRLHPILTRDLALLQEVGDVVAGGETVCIDLRKTTAEHWSETRENHKRSIKKAQQAGYTARIDHDWEKLGEFRLAYEETMRRVDANAYYFFDDAYYSELRAALGERLHLLVVERAGEVAAAALFTECAGIVQYHLGGTRTEHLAPAPMKLLFHFARDWFRERGATIMHLGGGVGSQQDSLFHFKAGFSDQRSRFHSWRVIADEASYRERVDAWRRASGREPNGSFFPAYRERV